MNKNLTVDTIIKNGICVTHLDMHKSDIAIHKGKIFKIGDL